MWRWVVKGSRAVLLSLSVGTAALVAGSTAQGAEVLYRSNTKPPDVLYRTVKPISETPTELVGGSTAVTNGSNGSAPAAVPEPGAALLFAAGLGIVSARIQRRRTS
jgi:hypothetical protein